MTRRITVRVVLLIAWTVLWVVVSAVLGDNFDYWRSGSGPGGTPLWSAILWFMVCAGIWTATRKADGDAA